MPDSPRPHASSSDSVADTGIDNNRNESTTNTSTSSSATAAAAPPLRDDELSRRIYYGGLAGLPWLWIVHTVYYYGKQRKIDAQRILRQEHEHNNYQNEDNDMGGTGANEDDGNDGDHATELAGKERMWVMRCQNSAIAVSIGWLTWVILVQIVFPDSLPSSWYVRDPNSYAATGW